MVETPSARRRTAQSGFDGSDADGDSSSAADSSSVRRAHPRRRTTRPKFIEHIDEDEVTTSPDTTTEVSGLTDDKTYESFHDGTPAVKKESNTARREKSGANGQSGNGHSNGSAPARANGSAKEERLIDGWRPGLDPKVDYSGHFEFGGTLGTSLITIGSPLLMWYMWLGATQYDGQFPTRAPGQSWGEFGRHLVQLCYVGAFPHPRAWAMYWIFFVFEGACYCLLPGVWAYGKPLPHEGGKQLKYWCSAYVSWYATMAIMGVLHFTGLFPLQTIIDEFGPLLSVAVISGFSTSVLAYFSALARGAQHRMTGYRIYDFFMGAELNPRMFGILDFKMFFEVRLPWYILFLISCGAAARQYEVYGYVSAEVWFLVMAHFIYANACSKGEELIVPSWDMYYEKWGFMLIFWNMAGVPLSYCHCSIYLALHDPATYNWNRWALGALFLSYLFVYWVWDSCNSQKNRFRCMERGTMIKRNTFPQLPWQTIHNPRKIPTSTGDSILVDGWYGLARKVHYTCDVFFAVTWGLITGFSSPFPWFYPVFFCCMIAHRAWRDIQRCREKYGEAWREYERQVPYLFIPVSRDAPRCRDATWRNVSLTLPLSTLYK
jgi:delta24(24(1))-sterol reductase